MKLIKYEGVAACSPAQLFRIINAVEYYPKFLSWCKETSIHNRQSSVLQASVFIKKYGFSFRCPFKYTLHSNKEIIVSLPSGGPFYTVAGLWRFQAAAKGTQFSFELRLDYKPTWWMNYFLIPMIRSEVKSLIKAFEQRASSLHA